MVVDLLTVVLVIQEWTDHKNLSYLRSACRVNSYQARWALCLGRFNFTITYQPSSQNIKLDALSHHLTPSVEDTTEETILLPSCMVRAARWEIE